MVCKNRKETFHQLSCGRLYSVSAVLPWRVLFWNCIPHLVFLVFMSDLGKLAGFIWFVIAMPIMVSLKPFPYTIIYIYISEQVRKKDVFVTLCDTCFLVLSTLFVIQVHESKGLVFFILFIYEYFLLKNSKVPYTEIYMYSWLLRLILW